MANWGAVGILPNPERSDDGLLASVCKRWTVEYIQAAKKLDFNLAIAPGEKPAITESGVFDLEWPKPIGETPLDFDVILATATSPTVTPDYPSINEIADAWIYSKDTSKRYEQYFFRNIENGIRTFQDGAIWHRIQQLKPEWANDFPVAVEKLQGQ